MAVNRLFIHCKGIEYRRQLSITNQFKVSKVYFAPVSRLLHDNWLANHDMSSICDNYYGNISKTKKKTKRKEKIIENRLNCIST